MAANLRRDPLDGPAARLLRSRHHYAGRGGTWQAQYRGGPAAFKTRR